MPLRECQIDRAYERTFRWVLDDSRQDIGFVQWLRENNSMFWIQGKAGSGKSTLMKYICRQQKTYQYLEEWAGTRVLATGKFFFWNSGARLQKSPEGLLISLLCQVLQQHSHLTSYLNPQQVNLVDGAIHSEIWDIEDLSNMIHGLLQGTPEMRYCFFIDGLDEFEGDLHVLIRILDTLSNNKNLKLCVSSRPEVQLNDAYSQFELLRVQDLTENDIKVYASGRLTKHKAFQRFDQRGIIYQITRRASGVFLWVVLVVKSLIEGLDYGDDYEAIQRRLDDLPDDLNALFLSIIMSIPETYRVCSMVKRGSGTKVLVATRLTPASHGIAIYIGYLDR
ncbi:P-loop containing nucleoside triphosphate hydrolase protein [Xylariaceae sp. FL1019]|nr:P-loop containing nucleoside triphosphate hydrolase protein [Xylariaceae sp. FL1019]